MATLKKIGFAYLLVLLSCSQGHKADEMKYNLTLKVDPYISIQFKTGTLKLNFDTLRYRDTLIFSVREREEIINSFNRFKIDDINGEVDYFNELQLMPPSNFEIDVLELSGQKSKLIVSNAYKENILLPIGKRYRVISFINDIKRVVQKNIAIKKAHMVLEKYKRDHDILELNL